VRLGSQAETGYSRLNTKMSLNKLSSKSDEIRSFGPLPIPGLFFVGTDTEVGKTFQAALLARSLRQRQVRVGVYKPVLSGLADLSLPSGERGHDDATILGAAAGLDSALIPMICPQRFSAPLAPPLAAQLESRLVDERLLYNGALWWSVKCDFLLVEGAGGLMSPVSSNLTVIDLAAQFGLPVVLVAANRLGCISHTLLAAEALRCRSINLLAVVLNRLPPQKSGSVETGSLEPQNSLEPRWEKETINGNLQLLHQWLPGTPLVQSANELVDLIASQYCHVP
jgi:dethiobiotin synthetase